ncbi:MAG: hypothetical protein PUC37_03200 [Spirochaetales bacterium]|nr:hypothetical protein [Spirochaetales bacterium]
MKKIILAISIFLLIFGVCIAQASTKPSDYTIQDLYVYHGNINDIGKKDYYSYSFTKTPVFADESENFYDALLEGKIVPLERFQKTFSIPITVQYEKEKVFLLGEGYYGEKYNIPEEYKKYNEEIENTVKNSRISYVEDNSPEFLKEYKGDDKPLGTIINCETFAVITAKSINTIDAFPFSFKDTITDSNGKKKKKNRTILILTVSKPKFSISDEGTVIEVLLPQKENFETPFGTMELFKSEINLKTTIPSSISVGTTTSIWDAKDYEYNQVTSIKNETELKSLYQTRKGYEIKNNICAKICGYHITEKDGEFYIGKIHLICDDKAWTKIHSEVTKKEIIENLLIDLRFIDNKIVFVIAPKL